MGVIKTNHNDTNKEEEYWIKGTDTNFTPEPKGVGYAFYKSMKRNKHAIAQRDGLTGVKDTYGSLLKRCIYTALEMQARGINPNDIVTICSLNHLNSCVPVIAATFIGAKMSCLDSALSLPDTVHLIKQVRPKMIFVGPEALELIEKAFQQAEIDVEIVVFGPSLNHSEFSDFFAPKKCEDFKPIEVEDNKETVLILFSSGTTGMPKGICISHCALLGQANNMTSVGYTLDVCLTFASFYWISAVLVLATCILSGGSRLVVPRYNPTAFWKLIEQFKVTLTFMAPSHAIAMYNKGRPDGINTTHLSDAIIGGGPISAEYVTKIREIFPGSHIAIVYGQTEITGIGFAFHPNVRQQILNMYDKPGSAGTILPGFTCRIVDPDSEKTLGPNQRGELRLKSEYIMNGYFNMDSTSVWDADGWLKTGDVAYYDDEHCFYIVDRIKEMLKFQSWHVPPALIEGILLLHPSVAMAVVVGMPHEEDGDHPAAAVVLKNPNDTIQPKEIEKFVEERVDDKQRLRGGIRIFTKLPLTATGKIRRADIRKMMV